MDAEVSIARSGARDRTVPRPDTAAVTRASRPPPAGPAADGTGPTPEAARPAPASRADAAAVREAGAPGAAADESHIRGAGAV